MAARALCLGAVVLAVALLAAYIYRRRRAKFSVTTPATPRIREASAEFCAELQKLGVQAQNELHVDFSAMTAASARLARAPPTYVNHLALYRGLETWGLAERHEARAAHYERVAAGTPEGAPTEEFMNLAAAHRRFAATLRRVDAARGRLGAALGVD